MTQTERVLEYMKEHGSISPLEAADEIGCMRLAARIADLKESGVAIRTEMVHGKKINGVAYKYARYRLEE